jgi:hypothetical protein
MKPIYFLLMALVLLYSCDLPDAPAGSRLPADLLQNWRFTYSEGPVPFAPDSIGRAGLFYCFFADGQVTRLASTRYSQGTWRYDRPGQHLEIDFPGDRGSRNFTVLELSDTRLSLQMLGSPRAPRPQFFATGQRFDRPEANPFHPANNQWRIRPARRETDAELRLRLKNHVGHYIKVLEAAFENTAQAVTFRHAPSCLQIYRSAIAVRELDQADPGWADCFFDREDAEKATAMLREAVAKKNKTVTKSDMWAKDVLELLRAAEAVL